MRRHEVRVVIARVVVAVAGARRLDADEHVSRAPARDREAFAAQRRVGLGRPPAGVQRVAHRLRQARDARAVVVERIALERRAQRMSRRIVGHAGREARDQRVAVGRQVRDPIAGLAQHREHAERRGRRVEPDAVADPPFAHRIVGEDQRDPLVGVRARAQRTPAAAQLGDERDAFRVRLVAHHVDFGVRTTIGEPLEADRARDDAPVHLGQRHVHRDVARVQPLRVGLPGVAIAARQDHLQHRRIARERGRRRIVERARRKRRGVQHERDPMLGAQRVEHRAAQRILQRRHRDRQGIEPFPFERFAQRVEHRRVGGLPVRAIEQDRDDRRAGPPARAPILAGRVRMIRVVQRSGRQRARRRRLRALAERMMRDAAQQRLGVLRAALAQVAPPLPAQRRIDGAFSDQVRVFLQVAREHRELLPLARGERDRLLDPVRPVALAAEMVDHDDARVAQHVVEVEIDRRGLAQERHVREPHARKTLAQPRHRGREQRQRRVGRTEDHDVGRTLVDPDHALGVVDEAARRGAQQMHRCVTPVAARPRAPHPARAAVRPGRGPRRSARSG